MIPNVYFSYGMTKSGSTLGFELARTGLELSGFAQDLLPADLVEMRRINFVQHLDDDAVARLVAHSERVGHPVALKTHTRPDPAIVRLLQDGQATAHAIFRDPRDMALSMLDHGRRARAKGAMPFSEYHTLADTIDPIRHQTNSLLAWLSLPNVRPLYYDDLAFDTERTARRIAADLEFDCDVATLVDKVQNERFTQLNSGRRDRYRAEMSAADSDMFIRIFEPLFARLITPRDKLPVDGSPVLDPAKPLCHWDVAPAGAQ